MRLVINDIAHLLVKIRVWACLGAACLMAGLTGGSACAADKPPPFSLPDRIQLNRISSAVISTARGDIFFELFPADAPWHVANFKYRADKGYYRNSVFHIVYSDYIAQGGGPAASPHASAPYSLPAEFNDHKHIMGALGMARRADYANPDRRSSGNQFHIILGDSPHMDGAFTVFGQLLKGEEVLESLQRGDTITDIKVFVRGK